MDLLADHDAANSGSSVVVRSLTSPPSQQDSVVVAGSFATAGSLPCQGICSWNTQEKQWQTLGNGIKGEVSAITYAGVRYASTCHFAGFLRFTGQA